MDEEAADPGTRHPLEYDEAADPGTRHPLEYDEVAVPLLLKPVSWVAFGVGAALVPVKVVLIAVLGLFGVVLSDLLPQRIAGGPLQVLFRCAMACFGVLPGCLSVDDRRTADDRADPAPIVILAPHCGMLEGFFACYYFWVRVIMMAPYAKIPVLRSLVKANNSIVVKLKRHEASSPKVAPEDTDAPSPKKASSAAREAILEHTRAFDPAKKSQACAILPEGTTHNGAALLTFFTGAFSPGAPVQPVIVRYPHKYFDAASFCGSLASHLLRQVVCLYVPMTVTVLPVYRPTDDERADPELYASNVWKHMAEGLGVPLSHYGAKRLNEEYYAKQTPKRRPGGADDVR